MDPRNDFFRFVLLRQLTWFNRWVLILPRDQWPADPVFQKHRFTNVYRFLDRGTQFAVGEIMEKSTTGVSLLQDLLVYRYTNNIRTYQNIIGAVRDGDFKVVRETIEEQVNEGHNLYTSAYITTYCPKWHMGKPIRSLVRQLQVLQDSAWDLEASLDAAETPEEAHKAFLAIHGIGPFLAYQLLGDLRIPLAVNDGKPTLNHINTETWTHIGAGAKAGLALITKRPAAWKWTKTSAIDTALQLRDMQLDMFKTLETDGLPRFPFITDWSRDPLFGDPVPLTVHDIEHSLCEFFKYKRAQAGGMVKGGPITSVRDGWTPTFVTIPAYAPKVYAMPIYAESGK